MDRFLASGHLICVLFGIPINLVIILFIVAQRHLRRQPRNIIWIGICFSNISVLFTNIIELIGFFSPEMELCHIRFLLIGYPVASLLMNHLFSLVDRFISIFHSVLYRRRVTVRLVLGIQVVAFILLFLLMKPHYIFGLIQVRCNVVPPLDRTIYFGFISFLVTLCLTGQLTLYFMIKKHLKLPSSNGGNDTTTNAVVGARALERNISQHNPSRAPAKDNNDEITISPEEAVKALGQHEVSCNVMKNNRHFVKIRQEMVSRLELEATQNVILSVGLILLFVFLWIISSILALICHVNFVRQALGNEEEKAARGVEQCSPYYWAISYTRLILLIAHSIYQSVCYVARSKDFFPPRFRAQRRRAKRCSGAETYAERRLHRPQKRRKVHRFRYRQPRNARLIHLKK